MSELKKRIDGLKKRSIALSDKYFPERQLVLRTEGQIRYLKASKRLQMSVAAAAFAFTGWSAYTTVNHFLHDGELIAKDQEILSVQVAYRSLLGEVNEYQNKFTVISNELEANHSMLVASMDKAVIDNKDKLVSAEAARKEAQIARMHLNTQLESIEDSMRELASRNYSLKGDLSLKEMDLQTALAERNSARLQKQHLESKLREVEIKLARANHTHDDLINRVTETTSEEIADLESLMTTAGLDPDKMLAQLYADPSASGGPFVAASKENMTDGQSVDKSPSEQVDLTLARWQGLQRIKQTLPLAQPLDSYYISSRYGKRRDPVNKRWAMHYGLDMAATKKTPVYVTAPGKVTFVGWKGNYGRFIEVDHGNGVQSRYGHLHKALVKKGDEVDYRSKIGLVGNTGRSTGAHLHYEIRVNGKNVDPSKFIKAGRNVFQG